MGQFAERGLIDKNYNHQFSGCFLFTMPRYARLIMRLQDSKTHVRPWPLVFSFFH